MSKIVKVSEDPRINFTSEDRAKKKAALNQIQPLITQASIAQFTIVTLRTTLSASIESWKRPGAPQVPDNVKKAADELLKKIDDAYPTWGTPPAFVNPTGSAGPPLVDLPTPLNQRVTQLAFGIEGTSAAPTDWEMSQIQILLKRVPEAAGIVRKLAGEDLEALNKMMREANIQYISMPAIGGGGGGGRRPPEDEDNR